jgi:hypothetical protein
MSEKKEQPSTMQVVQLALNIGLVLYFCSVYFAKPDSKPDEPKPVVVTIEKATAGVLAAMKIENARVFTEAANKVEKGELKTDKELFDFVQPATKLAREQANKPFDVSLEMTLPRNDDGTFAGKEIEAGKVLRRIAKSW